MAKKELNRKEYERIRKMDHKTMEDYFRSVYEAGVSAGREEERELSDWKTKRLVQDAAALTT
ncbi:MAG: hypothetical protein LUD12_13225 [Lachnospiraceae bacterium]|nr:hypothetical protein [Lachnospiraceae bacterium]